MRIFTAILLVFPLFGLGQISLERQVVSTFAVNGTGSYYISSTGGQPEYTTAGDGTILTQGFEQPPSASLIVDFLINYPACGATAEVQVDEVFGCANEIDQIIINDVVYQTGNVFLPAGDYVAEIVAGAGCNSSVTISIDPSQLVACEIFFPNTVTNNGDWVNDFWEILNVELPQFSSNQVFIYNRWGQKVWEGLNYDNSSVFWQGEDTEGIELPVGTYFYEFRATDDLIFEGFIELFR